MSEAPRLHGELRAVAFIGLAPGRDPEPGEAPLVPLGPDSMTGQRLAELLGRPVLEVGCTANVLPSPRHETTGRLAYERGAALRELLAAEKVERVVILGMDAARLMGLRYGRASSDLWFSWEWDSARPFGLYYAIAPHPSGRSRWWNDEANRNRARWFFGKVARIDSRPFFDSARLARLCSAIVSRLLAEDVDELTEENVRRALAPCVGGAPLVEAGLAFLREGHLAPAFEAARGALQLSEPAGRVVDVAFGVRRDDSGPLKMVALKSRDVAEPVHAIDCDMDEDCSCGARR